MRTFPLVAAALVAVAAAGCSSNDGTTASPTPTPAAPTAGATTGTTGGSAAVVHAKRGNTFSPSTVSIAAGGTVKVVDDDGDAPHNFVVDGVGGSKTLQEGDEFSLTFPKAGTFEFVCTFHEAQGMKGTVTVS